MSEEQIRRIMGKLAEQDKVLRSILREQTRQKQEMEPVLKLLHDAMGFRDITIVILKGVILLGSAAGVIAGFIYWLREK
jgi:hypothetical protein